MDLAGGAAPAETNLSPISRTGFSQALPFGSAFSLLFFFFSLSMRAFWGEHRRGCRSAARAHHCHGLCSPIVFLHHSKGNCGTQRGGWDGRSVGPLPIRTPLALGDAQGYRRCGVTMVAIPMACTGRVYPCHRKGATHISPLSLSLLQVEFIEPLLWSQSILLGMQVSPAAIGLRSPCTEGPNRASPTPAARHPQSYGADISILPPHLPRYIYLLFLSSSPF